MLIMLRCLLTLLLLLLLLLKLVVLHTALCRRLQWLMQHPWLALLLLLLQGHAWPLLAI
jgi:hypothetical protein